MGNERERKHNFLQHKGNSNIKKPYTEGSKSTGRKVGFVAVFADFTRSSIHPHSWNNSNKNSIEREPQKMGNI